MISDFKRIDDILPGTSFHGDVIYTSLEHLIELFDKPDKLLDSKVNYEWSLQYKDIPFYIYDWKEDDIIELDKPIYWHIGAFNEEDSKIVYNSLKELL